MNKLLFFLLLNACAMTQQASEHNTAYTTADTNTYDSDTSDDEAIEQESRRLREESRRLREENRRLQQQNEQLKRAAGIKKQKK